jgi:SAM-dependent methyltransferase
VCGFRGKLVSGKVLWPELIAEWELDCEWAQWIDQREGPNCIQCGANLRSSQLAQVIVELVKVRTGITANSLRAVFEDPRVGNLKIAEINSAGALHQFLSKSPNLLYSEFGSKVAGVASEDIMCLSYADSSFDYVFTSDTLEHVPDVDVALGEIYRVLKPLGQHVFTVPIVWNREQTRQRAYIKDGKLVHILPPSYHGAPKDNKDDYLVFYEFGADFVDRCRRAGFDIKLVRDENNPALVVVVACKNR